VAEEKQAMYVVLRDITVRVKAEEALKNSLREKSALLSEVHHRVKNNLAVISGLMQLQVYKSNSDENTKVLNKSINRIRSIALIHEQLYATENFSRLLLNDHIEKQVNYIQELFKAQEEKNIRIQLNLNDVHININQALPVGLMVNEILTNAFKYAFRDRNEGTIEINLKREGGYIDIAIKDDGVGVKGEISKDKSLGVNLIEIFAEQLEASMDIDTQSGVSYHIRFKEREVSGSIESQYMA
jgi:two-component sensor histidine kinase